MIYRNTKVGSSTSEEPTLVLLLPFGLPVFLGRCACVVLEIFAEGELFGEMKLLGNLLDAEVAVESIEYVGYLSQFAVCEIAHLSQFAWYKFGYLSQFAYFCR